MFRKLDNLDKSFNNPIFTLHSLSIINIPTPGLVNTSRRVSMNNVIIYFIQQQEVWSENQNILLFVPFKNIRWLTFQGSGVSLFGKCLFIAIRDQLAHNVTSLHTHNTLPQWQTEPNDKTRRGQLFP